MPGSFSTEEQAWMDAQVEDSLERMRSGQPPMLKSEKATIEEAMQSAGQWSADASRPWYKRPENWAWIIAGTTVVGVGAAVTWRYVQQRKQQRRTP